MMDSLSDSSSSLKRKRTSPNPNPESLGDRPFRGNVVGAGAQITYLVKAKPEKLRLIEGDGETFGEILAMIDDYEGM